MHRRRAACALALVALGVTMPALAATRQSTTQGPAYTTYQAAPAAATDAGEPSIGVDWRNGVTILQASLDTFRLDFAGNAATWKEVAPIQTSLVSLDPILFTDAATGRTFVSQLTAAGSLMTYTDDDGATWSQSEGSGLPAGADHQSVGGGPYPPEAGVTPLSSYPHAVYYCSQDILTAFCARSDNGGQTFGAGVPIYTVADCGGLHGHVKVAPDGTVYVPNRNCDGQQGISVSRDAGTSWTLRLIPGSTRGDSDPSVGTGTDGTIYVAYGDSDGHAKVAVSRDRGLTWLSTIDLSKQVGVQSALFPVAVAGDGDRAAVAYLGTRTPGEPQDAAFGQDATGTRYVGASYHLFVATTYTRGQSWQTVDVTGSDPVQRGRICMSGTACTGGDRNLLDFMDITVDREGRVLVGWADGCTTTCVASDLVASNTHTAWGEVSRQTRGTGLFRRPPNLAR